MTDQPATNVPAVTEKHSLKEVAIQNHGMGAHLVPQSMADVVRFSDMMAKGGIAVRKHLRDNPGACLAVTLQALDWGMNPISVGNKSYAVNDQLAYEAQLINAVILARAPIVGRPDYDYTGEPGKTRRCKVSVTTTDGQVLDITSPEVQRITVKNSPLWKTDEDMQLGYYTVRNLARRHFPEIILGVYDLEEAQSMRDVTPRHRETTGLRERLEANRMQTGDKGFSRESVEQAIDGEFTDAETVALAASEQAEKTLGEMVVDALDGDDLPDGLKATHEPESGLSEDDWLRDTVIGEDPRVIAAWIERFKIRCGKTTTAQQLMDARMGLMDQIRKIFEVAPQRGEELDVWFGAELKARRGKKES